MVVLVLSIAASLGAVGAWALERRRGHQRNGRGECGACGALLSDPAAGSSFVIHGRLVCEICAAKARRRMPWELGGLGAWAALVAGTGLANLVFGPGITSANLALLAIGLPAVTIAVPVIAVQVMKRANRNVQRRIAAGEFVTGHSLETGTGASGDVPLIADE